MALFFLVSFCFPDTQPRLVLVFQRQQDPSWILDCALDGHQLRCQLAGRQPKVGSKLDPHFPLAIASFHLSIFPIMYYLYAYHAQHCFGVDQKGKISALWERKIESQDHMFMVRYLALITTPTSPIGDHLPPFVFG